MARNDPRTVLVTGGCGFIGSHFVRLLLSERPWRVVNVDRLTYAGNLENLSGVRKGRRYRFVNGDVADREAIHELTKEERPWALVNFAAESHVDRSILDSTPFTRTNVIGVQNLLEAARASRVERFLQISTDEVYGDAEGAPPFSENTVLVPSSPYAATKAAADLLCLAYQRTHGVAVLIARSTNNYGPRQFPEKLIPLMIRNAVAKRELPVYGDGLQQREWVYVTDNCRAILAVLEQGRDGEIYNVGAGNSQTNIDVVRLICELVARESGQNTRDLMHRIRLVPDRPGHDRRYALDTRKIREELGWSATTSFVEGMQTTVRWYLDHSSWVRRMTSGDYEDYYRQVYTKRREGSP